MPHPRVVTVVILVAVVASATVRADERPIDHERIRQALRKPASALTVPPSSLRPAVTSMPAASRSRQAAPAGRTTDPVWEGLLIGAAAGGVGGYFWARQICGPNDTECLAISAPVGILGGAGIGALVGAVADKLHR